MDDNIIQISNFDNSLTYSRDDKVLRNYFFQIKFSNNQYSINNKTLPKQICLPYRLASKDTMKMKDWYVSKTTVNFEKIELELISVTKPNISADNKVNFSQIGVTIHDLNTEKRNLLI